MSVIAQLTYMHDDGERPFLYARPRTRKDKHKTDFGGSPDLVNVEIKNGRQHKLELDQNAFQLVPHSTTLTCQDFLKQQQKPNSNKKDANLIETIYFQEIKQLIQKTTGAQLVHCFHYQVRTGNKQNNNAVKSDNQYVTGIHTDSSPSSAQETFMECLQAIQKEQGNDDTLYLQKGRFLYINAWRNISDSHPILDNHLAVCDETSLVKPDDYIPYDYYDHGNYASVHYNLSSRNAHLHRWYYFPEMRKDEVLLFKQFDSNPHCPARMCFHASFSDPTANTGMLHERQSIEVRCMAFFPHHQPDTIRLSSRQEIEIRLATSQILQAVEYVHEWDRPSRWWFKDLVKRKLFHEILKDLIKDKRNEMGFKEKQFSTSLQLAIQQCAMDRGFVETCQRQAARL